MKTLAALIPEFAEEVRQALLNEGYQTLASAITTTEIAECSFDETVNMGYLTFVCLKGSGCSAPLAAPIAKTLSFASPHWFNVDVDHDGFLFGIELDGREDVVARLREQGILK